MEGAGGKQGVFNGTCGRQVRGRNCRFMVDRVPSDWECDPPIGQSGRTVRRS